jgi:hypothetical protein
LSAVCLLAYLSACLFFLSVGRSVYVCPSEANDQVALSQLLGYVWSWFWFWFVQVAGIVWVQVVALIAAGLSGSLIQVQVVAL